MSLFTLELRVADDSGFTFSETQGYDLHLPPPVLNKASWILQINMAETTPPTGNSSQFGVERPTTLIANSKANGDFKPNAGVSLQDREAEGRGEKGELISEWQKWKGIDKSKQIKIVKLVFVRYQHPDLKSTSVFLRGANADFTVIGDVADNEDLRLRPFLSEEDRY